MYLKAFFFIEFYLFRIIIYIYLFKTIQKKFNKTKKVYNFSNFYSINRCACTFTVYYCVITHEMLNKQTAFTMLIVYTKC